MLRYKKRDGRAPPAVAAELPHSVCYLRDSRIGLSLTVPRLYAIADRTSRCFLQQIGIVADDLTGALDAAGPFATRGLSTYVAISPYPLAREESGWDVLCYSTQTRNLDERDAAGPVRLATGHLARLGFRRLFKKIDSTLRGHVGIEIDAMLELSESPGAFIAPAFPALGRTVRDGVLFVDDRPLQAVQEGNDPLSQPGSASLVELLRRQTDRQVGLVGLASVERGEPAIEEDVGALIGAGCTLVAFDAATQEHLERIDAVLKRGWPDGLLVGSAGLASAVAAGLAERRVDAEAEPEQAASQGGIVLVSGSVNPATLTQLDRLKDLPGIRMVPMQDAVVLDSTAGEDAELDEVTAEVRRTLDEGYDPVLFWAGGVASAAPEVPPSEISERSRRLNSFLRRLAGDIPASPKLAAFVLVGGDTAHSILTGLHARGVVVHSEFEPGIPTGAIAGGPLDSTPLVTKAGGFGAPDALALMIEYLRKQRSPATNH